MCDEEAEDGKKPCYEETAPLDMMHARQVSAFQPWAPSMKVLAKMAEARERSVLLRPLLSRRFMY